MTAAPIETRSGAAHWTDDGRLVHYSACQGAHPTRDLLATVYGLEPVAGAGDRARHGWRLRRQVPLLPRGAGARLLRPAGRAAREVDRDTLGEHGGDAPRPGPVAAGQDGRHPRRPDHRLPARRAAGRGCLSPHRRGPADDDPAHDHRRVRPRQRRLHRRLGGHQHRLHHGLPGSGPARGGRGHRAHGRPVRGRDRHGPGRGAPAQPRPALHRAVHDRHRHHLRRGRLRRGPGTSPARRSATTSCGPSRPSAAPPATLSRSASGSPCTSRSPPACRAPSSERWRCSTAAGCWCAAVRRRTARATRRPGR